MVKIVQDSRIVPSGDFQPIPETRKGRLSEVDTRQQASAGLAESTGRCAEMLSEALGCEGRGAKFPRDGWSPPWAVGLEMVCILNVLSNSDKHRAVTLTLAYSHDLTVKVHANDGRIHVWKATEPLYAGDVHTIPLDLDSATIQPSARVEARGTEVLIIQEIGPWGPRPVWSVLTDLYEYARDRVAIPLKPFFVAPDLSSP